MSSKSCHTLTPRSGGAADIYRASSEAPHPSSVTSVAEGGEGALYLSMSLVHDGSEIRVGRSNPTCAVISYHLIRHSEDDLL